MDKPIVVDADVLVLQLDDTDSRHSVAKQALEWLRQKGYEILLPASVVLEFPCALARRNPPSSLCKSPDMAMRWLEWFLGKPGVKCLDLTAEDAYQAAFLGTQLGLKGMDALVGYCAFQHSCPLLTFNVKDFRRIKLRFENLAPQSVEIEAGLTAVHGPSLGFEFYNKQVLVLTPPDLLQAKPGV